MAGLVFADRLTLSLPQMAALALSMWAILVWADWRGVITSQAFMLAGFWGTSISIDTRLLFASARNLHQFAWPGFLSELAFQDYVKFQPPFYTYLISRCPSLPLQQIFQAGLMMSGGLVVFRLYGRTARLLLSTPLFLLMSTQPSNDAWLLIGLLVTLRLTQMRRRRMAAILYGLLWLIKPLMVVTMPFMLPKLKGWIMLSLVIIAGYIVWSSQYYFGVKQWQFLLFQFSFGRCGAQ